MSQRSKPTGPVPALDRSSFWERDPVLRRALRRALPHDVWTEQEPTFAAIGADAADRIDRLAAIADRESPRLVARDPAGNPTYGVEYHPAYREIEAAAYGTYRLVGVKYDPEMRARGVAQRVGFARTLQFGMGEAGVLCPVCMTDGVARVLERSGDEELAKQFIPRLCWGEGEPRGTGAMFLTEKAGGSDVGRVETVARKAGDKWEMVKGREGETATFAMRTGEQWRLSGEKWFCSNVDAEYVLALARPDGAPEGTRGLGLFLIERAKQTGETFRIERLKDKLGTRSMPTGEVILQDAPALRVGRLSEGFKQMAGMLNLSRLYNSVVSCSAVGRAWLEARAFAEQRVTFGTRVSEHPLAAEVLAAMEAEYAGTVALVLEACTAIDRADGGDAEAEGFLRAMTPLIKLFTAKVAVATASEAVEFLGGCGYIEDWPTPRILRDAQVLPIWEGTTNILSLDLVRVASKQGLAPLLKRGRAALDGSTAAALAPARDRAAALLAQAEEGFAALAGGASPAPARGLAFRLARGLECALLAEAAEEEPDGPEGRAALRLSATPHGPCL